MAATLIEVVPGVFTDARKLARKVVRERAIHAEYEAAFLAGEWPRWDEEEGKWDL